LSQDFESKNKGVDITVEAGGSGFGISQVADGYADIGNASKNPFSVVKKSYQNNWQAKNIKTMTIGWEGICIV
jgi:phosphate transport system substrate-binding protein